MFRTTAALLAGGVVAQGLLLFQDGERDCGLTAEQRAILAHMRLVQIDDGFGNPLDTIQIEGANVQIVNGTGTTTSANGLGNLIVGYNEPGSLSPNRTGSHNVIIGLGNDYTATSGIVSGWYNQILGDGAVVLGGFGCAARADFSAVFSGNCNDVGGRFGVILSGDTNTIDAFSDHDTILGSWGSTMSGGQNNVIVGGSSHMVEGSDYSTVVGGDRTYLFAGRCTTLGGVGNRLVGAESSTMVGGDGNVIDNSLRYVINATVVGGKGNRAATPKPGINPSHDQTVIGGEGNVALGNASVVGGGLNRSATGDYDWVAGGLFQEQ